jgi:hypothetical protein
VDKTKLRAWWAHRQGLDGGMNGQSPDCILERTGWARSVGGSGPYLSLFARGGLSRETVDAAVASAQIQELPSARGCTYVLPASDFDLGLLVGRGFSGGEQNTAAKLGVTAEEIENLCRAVLRALSTGPLNPEQLKQATGNASRSLGVDGSKKGVGHTMSVALDKLQAEGRIRRIPANGRLDQQRYRYTLWHSAPIVSDATSPDPFDELARRFFHWIGPATIGEFQWFSGLGVKAAKATAQRLDLVRIEPESDRWLPAEDLDAWESFAPPSAPCYSLISSLDNLLHLRRDLSLLLDDAASASTAWTEKGARPLGGLSDSPHNAIVDRGRTVGLWEYEVSSASIVWKSFGAASAAMKAAVAGTEKFIREQLGDARSFSLDGPKQRSIRIQQLKAD